MPSEAGTDPVRSFPQTLRPGTLCEVPSWTFLAGVYAGVATSGVSGYAHFGVERELTDQLSLGALAFGFANPYQGGPALRFDGNDVGAIRCVDTHWLGASRTGAGYVLPATAPSIRLHRFQPTAC